MSSATGIIRGTRRRSSFGKPRTRSRPPEARQASPGRAFGCLKDRPPGTASRRIRKRCAGGCHRPHVHNFSKRKNFHKKPEILRRKPDSSQFSGNIPRLMMPCAAHPLKKGLSFPFRLWYTECQSHPAFAGGRYSPADGKNRRAFSMRPAFIE